MRRLRRVPVMAESFIEVMKHGIDGIPVANALPADAQYVGAVFDHATLQVWLLVESAAFDEVRESEEMPSHGDVQFMKRAT